MPKKSIVFFCQNILSDENRTQYNRTRFLCNSYSTHIVGMGMICPKASLNAASVNLFPLSRIFKLLYPVWALWTIYFIKKQFNIVYLYSTYEPPNIITSYIAKKIFKINWIADIWDDPEKPLLILKEFYHTNDRLLQLNKRIQFYFAKKLLKHADKVVTLIAKQLREKYSVKQNKMLSITNGINLEYNFDVYRKKSEEGVLTLFYCGTVDSIRLEGILPCMKEVVKEDILVNLIVIGYELKGGYSWIQNELEMLNEKVILDNRGVQSYNSVVQAIAESDVCLCPYPNKLDLAPAFPIKLFDYMAVGKPIVASALPGIRKIIKHEFNGLLFKPGDYLEMARLIIKLYNNPELRNLFSRNAKKSVRDFEWQMIHEKIFQFL